MSNSARDLVQFSKEDFVVSVASSCTVGIFVDFCAMLPRIRIS